MKSLKNSSSPSNPYPQRVLGRQFRFSITPSAKTITSCLRKIMEKKNFFSFQNLLPVGSFEARKSVKELREDHAETIRARFAKQTIDEVGYMSATFTISHSFFSCILQPSIYDG
jgi:hypothetical protein